MKSKYESIFEFDSDYLREHPNLEFFDRHMQAEDLPGGMTLPPKGAVVRVWRIAPGMRSREFYFPKKLIEP
jgi:hypothetical protein